MKQIFLSEPLFQLTTELKQAGLKKRVSHVKDDTDKYEVELYIANTLYIYFKNFNIAKYC